MKTVIKETEGFRLTLSKDLCAMPNDLFHIQMTQECLKDGEITHSSTYQFFMTKEEINNLSIALSK